MVLVLLLVDGAAAGAGADASTLGGVCSALAAGAVYGAAEAALQFFV